MRLLLPRTRSTAAALVGTQAGSRLLAILALGLALRLIWLAAMHNHPLWLDEPEYLQMAQTIRAGGYLDTFTWLRTPLYSLWLALTLGPTGSLLLARLGQVALGVLLIYQCYRLGLAWWQQRHAGELCALLAALYLPLVAFSSYLMADTLLLVLLCQLLLTMLAFVRAPAPRLVLLAGMWLGLAALVKPIALACTPALLLALWFGAPDWRRRLGYAALAGACCLAVIAPWTLRNALVHERFILLDTTGGFNLWFGNRALDDDPLFFRSVHASVPNPADREAMFVARAWENIHEQPAAAAQLVAGKLLAFWRPNADVLATRDYGQLALPCFVPQASGAHGILEPAAVSAVTSARFCSALWLNLLSDLLYVPLLLGALVAPLHMRAPRLLALGLSWIIPIYLATALTVVQPRLRLPLLPVLLPWGTYGLLYLSWQARRLLARSAQPAASWHRLTRWQTVLLVVLLLVGLWLLRVPALLGSQVWQSIGSSAWQAGEPTRAFAAYQAAAQWHPQRVSALLGAGQAAEALGNYGAALAFYRAAIAQVSYEPEARIGVARIVQAQGNTQAARAELGQTLLGRARIEAWAFAAPMLPTRTCLDIGRPQVAANYGYTMGLYPTDQTNRDPTFRPMGETASLRFGSLPMPAALLSLRVSGSRPANAPPAELTLSLHDDSQPTSDSTLLQTDVPPDWRTYHVLLPPTTAGTHLSLQASTFIPAEYAQASRDQRPYGLALDWAAVHAMDTQADMLTTSTVQVTRLCAFNEPATSR